MSDQEPVHPSISFAPWTDEQVTNLNNFQEHGMFHPYTCPNDDVHTGGGVNLVAEPDGWKCPLCKYEQYYASRFMADGLASTVRLYSQEQDDAHGD